MQWVCNGRARGESGVLCAFVQCVCAVRVCKVCAMGVQWAPSVARGVRAMGVHWECDRCATGVQGIECGACCVLCASCVCNGRAMGVQRACRALSVECVACSVVCVVHSVCAMGVQQVCVVPCCGCAVGVQSVHSGRATGVQRACVALSVVVFCVS